MIAEQGGTVAVIAAIYAHLSTKKRREDIAKYLEGNG
jgi:hypothetical protein